MSYTLVLSGLKPYVLVHRGFRLQRLVVSRRQLVNGLSVRRYGCMVRGQCRAIGLLVDYVPSMLGTNCLGVKLLLLRIPLVWVAVSVRLRLLQ